MSKENEIEAVGRCATCKKVVSYPTLARAKPRTDVLCINCQDERLAWTVFGMQFDETHHAVLGLDGETE